MNSLVARSNLDAAFSLADRCRLCPRRCGAGRLRGESGACGAGRHARLFMEYVHWAEDAVIAPAQTLYLDGCNLSCSFCQTGEERARLPAARLTPELFRRILASGREQSAKSVDILGGEPGVNLFALLELFAESGDFDNLVWNTNLYCTAEACELLHGVADIVLGDVKFGSPACAARLAGTADATEVAWRRAEEIHARSPDALILRHLVLPGHFSCCTRPVLGKIAERFPGVPVSLKTVYMPPRGMRPDAPEKRFLSASEADAAFALARSLGLRPTDDAALPDSRRPVGGTSGADGEFEIAVTPDGGVYLRHARREAVDMLLAAARRERI